VRKNVHQSKRLLWNKKISQTLRKTILSQDEKFGNMLDQERELGGDYVGGKSE